MSREAVSESEEELFAERVVEPTKTAMLTAMAEATSKEDAVKRIIAALPKDRTYLGPLVLYDGENGGASIRAVVQTLDHRSLPVDIEVEYAGRLN